jgi:SAM-dependent methyltransferase
MDLYVQYGCGFSAPPRWTNFDSSPTLLAERLPIVGQFVKKNEHRFPANVKYGNIVKGLPVTDSSVKGAYASHVLEHLTRREFEIALRNTYRILAPGGVFRLILPDLTARCEHYLNLLAKGDTHANDWFMRETYLGLEERPRSPRDKLGRVYGGAMHLWMWDYGAVERALAAAGFQSIRRCKMGDSELDAFKDVESLDRFVDPATGIVELAVEARK